MPARQKQPQCREGLRVNKSVLVFHSHVACGVGAEPCGIKRKVKILIDHENSCHKSPPLTSELHEFPQLLTRQPIIPKFLSAMHKENAGKVVLRFATRPDTFVGCADDTISPAHTNAG